MDLRPDSVPSPSSSLLAMMQDKIHGRKATTTEMLVILFYLTNIERPDPLSPVQLGNESSSQSTVLYSQIPGFLHEMHRLLTIGADPNVTVHIYEIDGKKLHRLAIGRIDAQTDFFEGSFIDCFLGPRARQLNRDAIRLDMTDLRIEEFIISTRTPLIDASYAKDSTTASVLIQFGACISTKNNYFVSWRRNPFMPAVKASDYETLDLLLNTTDLLASEGSSVTSPMSQRVSPITSWLADCMRKALEIAANSDSDFSIALLLIRHCAYDPFTYFPSYIPQRIITHTIRHDIALPAIRKQEIGMITVAFLDHLELCTLAIENNADLKARDLQGLSALHLAVGNKNTEVCELLIKAGADINARDYYGMTPLLEATYYGNLEAVQLLLAKGANLAEVANHEVSPFTYSTLSNHDRVQGAWRERRNRAAEMFMKSQWSALHIAAHRGFSNIVRYLVNNGADLGIQDKHGCTPLDIAINMSNMATVAWLLSQKCPFNAQSEAASRLLGQAVKDCRYDAVQQLREQGVRILGQHGFQRMYILQTVAFVSPRGVIIFHDLQAIPYLDIYIKDSSGAFDLLVHLTIHHGCCHFIQKN